MTLISMSLAACRRKLKTHCFQSAFTNP